MCEVVRDTGIGAAGRVCVNMDIYDDESQGNGEGTGSGMESGVGFNKNEFVSDEMDSEKFFENGNRSKWLTTKSAAQFLQISETALRILVHREKVKAFKFGRRLRFSQSEIFSLIKRKGE